MRRDVFQAIADPTRRAIIGMLAQQPLNLNNVAEHFRVSRPAISKHIRILTECGLIEIEPRGRERYCKARLEKLNEVADWVTQYRRFWNDKLDALETYLAAIQAPKAASSKKTKPAAKKTVIKKRKSKRKS